MGVCHYLKPKVIGFKVILADPQGSGLFNKVKFGVMFNETESEGTRKRHQIDTIVEGVGLKRLTANFKLLDGLIDDAMHVTDNPFFNE